MPKTTKDNMELDDLKKSWNALDKQLQKENIIDEKQIAELIAKYKDGAQKSIKRITNWQKLSVYVGLSGFVVLILVLVIVPSVITDLMVQVKTTVMCMFFGLTLIFGMWWDLKTYRWSRDTKIDEMTTLVVMERIGKLRKWIKYEVIAISVWAVLFMVLYYWVMDYYKLAPLVQLILVASLAIIVSLIIYFLYKKMIYNHLNDANRNLNELKELKANH